MVHATAIEGPGGGRLRVGMIGGGRNAFIGAVHRIAMRLDDRIELKAGALSADPENAPPPAPTSASRPTGAMPTIAKWRCARRSGRTGSRRSVIVTPNHLHSPVAKAFLEAGIDVICDKPLSATLAEAAELVALTRAKRLVFVTLNNTGYAMVRQAREMVGGGRNRRGPRRSRRLCPGLADQADRRRRTEAGGVAHRSGPGRAVRACSPNRRACLQSLALFSGLEPEAVSADLVHRRARAPARRQCACHGAVGGGARGTLSASQTSLGNSMI